MRQKCIPNSFFERYGGLSFLLKCNCNSKNLEKDISFFYLEMVDSFKELRLNYQLRIHIKVIKFSGTTKT